MLISVIRKWKNVTKTSSHPGIRNHPEESTIISIETNISYGIVRKFSFLSIYSVYL